MATIVKTSERELADYVSEVSEHAAVRAGSPLPLGTLERGGGVNFAIFSRYRQPCSTRVVRPSRRRIARPDNRSGFSAQPHRRRMARLGEGDRSRSTLCLPRGWPLPTQRRTSFQLQQASPRSLCDRDFAVAPLGFCFGTWIRPVGAGTRLGFLEAGQFQLDAEMRICQRALRLAWRPAAPASLVEDRHLRNACSRLYDSSQVRRGASRNLPGPDGKDSLSQNPGSNRCGTYAGAGVQ